MTELMQASNEWFSRPDDERFLTLEDLHRATLDRADRSEAQIVNHDHIEAHGSLNGGKVMTLELPGIDEAIDPTNWSFGQVCSRARVPARFARETHPAIAADAINYNLRFVVPKDDSNVMLYRRPTGELVMNAITSATYGRIYDHRVVEAVQHVNADGRWVIPAGSTMTQEEAAVSKRATTLYASDRDVFIFLVDPSTPIEVPSPNGPDEVLFRGFMVWNSEVGSATFGIRTFLYRHVCDNRIVWGAEDIKTLKIRHTSGGPDRFLREGQPMLKRYSEESSEKTVKTIKKAMSMEVGRTDEDAEAWLKKRNFNASESKRIIAKAKEEEGEARTVWQLVQGGTAAARGVMHTNSRVDAEKRASSLMKYAEAAA